MLTKMSTTGKHTIVTHILETKSEHLYILEVQRVCDAVIVQINTKKSHATST